MKLRSDKSKRKFHAIKTLPVGDCSVVGEATGIFFGHKQKIHYIGFRNEKTKKTFYEDENVKIDEDDKYIGKIQQVYQEKKSAIVRCLIRWYYTPDEVDTPLLPLKRELIETNYFTHIKANQITDRIEVYKIDEDLERISRTELRGKYIVRFCYNRDTKKLTGFGGTDPIESNIYKHSYDRDDRMNMLIDKMKASLPSLDDDSEFIRYMEETAIKPCLYMGRSGNEERRDYIYNLIKTKYNKINLDVLEDGVTKGDCFGCNEKRDFLIYCIKIENDAPQPIGRWCLDKISPCILYYKFINEIRGFKFEDLNERTCERIINIHDEITTAMTKQFKK